MCVFVFVVVRGIGEEKSENERERGDTGKCRGKEREKRAGGGERKGENKRNERYKGLKEKDLWG